MTASRGLFPANQLRLGDNLQILRDRSLFPDECIDLIYLDPPLQPHRGSHTEAREVAPNPYEPLIFVNPKFWRWDEEAKTRYKEIQQTGTTRLRAVIEALHVHLGRTAMFAYICHMTLRLQESHRVLRSTGTIFLHCDPMVSHHLRLIMGALFGHKSLVNEIVWQRVESPKDALSMPNQIARIHDTILYYRKSEKTTFHMPTVAGSNDYLDHYYPHTEYGTGRRYRLGDVTSARIAPHSNYSWHIKRPLPEGRWSGDLDEEFKTPRTGWEYQSIEPYKNRYWALPREIMCKAERDELMVYGRTGYPHIKRYQKALGVPVQDIWLDIPPVTGDELLYPAQKPRLLLERIIAMSSNPGDVILDPFAGSGSTFDAVEMLNRLNADDEPRVWIGIESNSLGINLIKHRLARFTSPPVSYQVHGEIRDLRTAKIYAQQNPLKYQYWALGLMGARPVGRKGRALASRPIDGLRHFKEKGKEEIYSILVQAPATPVEPQDVLAMLANCKRSNAPLAVIISLESLREDTLQAARAAGFYQSPATGAIYQRVQLVTVDELLIDSLAENDTPIAPDNRCCKSSAKVHWRKL